MPGLAKTDDRTFVGAFQAMDRAILNPLFLSAFLGAFIFTGLATALSLGAGSSRWWLIVALVLYLIVMVITFRVNVPMNNAIKAATDPDLSAVRERFNEALWLKWNHVRSWLSTGAFACLAWTLVLYGKLL
jgi:uncharacterized membrane protein